MQKRGFYRRGGIIWLRTDPVTGKPKSTRSKTQRGAEAFLAERERHAADPGYAASHQTTLGEWVQNMMAEKQRSRASETVRFYKPKVGHLIRLFGEDAPLAAITPVTVDQYRDTREEEGAAHYTISKEFTALRQVLKRAKRAGQYGGDLTTLFPLGYGHGYEPRDTVLSVDAEARLRAELSPDRWGCIAFMLATAARLGEATRARREDWDPERRLFHVRGTKTDGSDRLVPALSLTEGYLLESLEYMPFGWRRMSKDLPEVCARLGLPKVTPNDLRRTAATRLIEAGVDPYLVAKITGHASLKMLRDVYDRSSPEAWRAAIEAQVEVARKSADERKERRS